MAHKWLKLPKVRAAIAELERPRLEKANLSAQGVIDAIAAQVEGDIRELHDEAGNIKPLHRLTTAQAAMIVGVEYVMKNARAGDGLIDRVLKIRLAPRDRYVEMAAKHFGLLVDRIEVVNVDEKIKTLHQGRAHAAALKQKVKAPK